MTGIPRSVTQHVTILLFVGIHISRALGHPCGHENCMNQICFSVLGRKRGWAHADICPSPCAYEFIIHCTEQKYWKDEYTPDQPKQGVEYPRRWKALLYPAGGSICLPSSQEQPWPCSTTWTRFKTRFLGGSWIGLVCSAESLGSFTEI